MRIPEAEGYDMQCPQEDIVKTIEAPYSEQRSFPSHLE